MMKQENFNAFKVEVNKILDLLFESGIKYKILSKPEEDNPTCYLKLLDHNLKNYKFAIWAVGEWSDFYATDDESEICIFMIHKWNLDKFRPSSADVSWNLLPGSNADSFIHDLLDIKKNPIKTYNEIFYPDPPSKKYLWNYYKDWYINVIKWPFLYNLRSKWSPMALYFTLKLISLFDHRVKKSMVFNGRKDSIFGNYTFGFLSTILCSENDKSFRKFYNLYSKFPTRLRKTTGLFDAYWNVADYDYNMTEKEIEIRLWKGIYLEEEEENESTN